MTLPSDTWVKALHPTISDGTTDYPPRGRLVIPGATIADDPTHDAQVLTIPGVNVNVRTITSDYTVDASGHDDTIICDTSGGPIALTLPSNVAGRCLNVIDKKNTFATHAVTLTRPGGTGKINNSAADLALSTSGSRVGIESDGTDWYTSL